MNILSQVNSLLSRLNIPVETGSMKKVASEKYIVLVPLSDSYPVSADNLPIVDLQELRITIFSKENYIKLKNQIISLLLSNNFAYFLYPHTTGKLSQFHSSSQKGGFFSASQ